MTKSHKTFPPVPHMTSAASVYGRFDLAQHLVLTGKWWTGAQRLRVETDDRFWRDVAAAASFVVRTTHVAKGAQRAQAPNFGYAPSSSQRSQFITSISYHLRQCTPVLHHVCGCIQLWILQLSYNQWRLGAAETTLGVSARLLHVEPG